MGDAARLEEAARASERNYRLLFAGNPQPMWVYDADTLGFVAVNDAAVVHYGYSREEFLSMTIKDLRPQEDVPALLESVALGRDEVIDRSGPWRHVKRDGTAIEVEITSHSVNFEGHHGRFVIAQDVTERQRLQRQLQHTQRLESLGQLAGGVAHDFNNLLNVIINYAAFVREELDFAIDSGAEAWTPARRDIVQIERAAERAARLTHQLLAFARREVVRPEVLVLDDVVGDMEEMLRRTLGEQIDLVVAGHEDREPIRADRGQLEQVLVNLAVNARDAMPSGGTLAIDTATLEVDEDYASARPGLTPGRYVRLRVSDTGTGMGPDVVQHAFEPFYTTKPRGQGTGLGLATIYGIVAQAGGHAQIYSEAGVGTTFTALLPTTDQPMAVPVEPRGGPARPGGTETILVVEDEPAIREVAERLLGRNGYRVITAANGLEAVDIARHGDPIDLLVTDVVMPHMAGREVAEQIKAIWPAVRVLYMSGYAAAVLGNDDVLNSSVLLVEKPFTEPVMLARIREALDTHEAPTM